MTAPQFRSDFTVEVIDHMGDDLSPLRAARVSTKGADSRTTEENDGLRRYLLREGHHVPFEHQVTTFYIEAPIFVTRQLLKHRISSISEESGRYRELDGVFYVPDGSRPVKQIGKTGAYEFVHDPDLLEVVVQELRYAADAAWDNYTYMLSQGVAKEVARMVLPVNTYSSMYFTANTRSLFNLFTLRSSWGEGHPQYEIREVADLMFSRWQELYPKTAEAWLQLREAS
jgi:thymidylate synthase (FAD)